MQTDVSAASARDTGHSEPRASRSISYDLLVAAALGGAFVFALECVDRLVTLWPSFNGAAEPFEYAVYLAPAALLGIAGGLVCAAVLLVARLVLAGSSVATARVPIGVRPLVAFAVTVVATALVLRVASAVAPGVLEAPLLAFVKKVHGRVVPIPFVVANFSTLFLLGTLSAVAAVFGVERALSARLRRVGRTVVALLAVAALALVTVLYSIDSRVFFGRYESTLHVPATVGIVVLAFLAAACGIAAVGGSERRARTVALVVVAASLALSAIAFVRLGDNENLKALLWRRSVLARRVYQVVAVRVDRDGDGFAGVWRGSDPDDTNPEIHPFAEDAPGNGVDENGFGGDATAATGVPADRPQVDTPAEARNFLFIAIDTLRADRMSVYGYGRPTSPRIAEWASSGRLFERAYSQGSNTGLSFASLQRSATGRAVFDKTRPTLFGTLERAGFVTTQINARRDDVWLETKRWRRYRRVLLDGVQTIDHTAGEPLWRADSVTTRAIEYLSTLPSGTRHATWLHYLDPHEPREKLSPYDFGDSPSDLYDTEVAYADREIGRLFDYLSESGALRDTVVVLVADHGESFGEHGMDLHGNRPYDEQIRVPLIVWAPGARPARIATPVALLDVAPTVLAALGLPGLPGAEGLSLLDDPPDRPIPCETPINLQDVNFHAYAVTVGSWRFIYDLNGGTRELYDLSRDPHELRNLADAEPARLAELEAILGRWVDAVGTVRPAPDKE